jgi:hypothetical protein
MGQFILGNIAKGLQEKQTQSLIHGHFAPAQTNLASNKYILTFLSIVRE